MTEQIAGRLAMRVEGEFWVAYYALPDTMEGAIPLGSIRMGAVQDKRRKQAFMSMMWELVADILEEKTGTRPIQQEIRKAPEHERTKE